MGPLWLARDPSDLTNMKIFDFFGVEGGGGGLYQICAIWNNYTNACATFLLKKLIDEIFAQALDWTKTDVSQGIERATS